MNFRESLEDDLAFCRDHVQKLDPWFRLHFVFAPRDQTEKILAIQALLAMLEKSLNSSEESVALAQLAWWMEELRAERFQVSEHPAVRLLRAQEEQTQLPSLADQLIAPMLERLQAEPLADEEALNSLCNRVGWPRISAQLGIALEDDLAASLSGYCSGSGLICLIDFALRSSENPWWFVPLSMQAKHQLDLSGAGKSGQGSRAVPEPLMNLLRDWIKQQRLALKNVQYPSTESQSGARYLIAMNASHLFRLLRIQQNIKSEGKSDPGKWGFSDMFRIWFSSSGLPGTTRRDD